MRNIHEKGRFYKNYVIVFLPATARYVALFHGHYCLFGVSFLYIMFISICALDSIW